MRLIFSLIFFLTSCSNLEQSLNIESNIHFYVSPRGAGLKPALVLVPDCFGASDYFKQRANQIANLGFHVLVLDLNGEGRDTLLPGESEELCKKQKNPLKTIKTALKKLKTLEGVDGEKISAIGYARGADLVFELGREGENLQSILLIQGSLESKNLKSSFKELKVLVLNGALDPSVTSREIKLFKKELKINQLTYEFVSFPGAMKGFYRPSATKVGDDFDLPFAYDEEADKTSFEKITNFLKNTLR
jgi:dienelactone hydrolase